MKRGASSRAGKAKLIDVREDSEWAAGHARGAQHMGKGVIERDIEQSVPDKNAELILYCGGGFRSALATDSLQKMGYTNVASMAGGWRAWQAAGGPTESESGLNPVGLRGVAVVAKYLTRQSKSVS